MRITNSMMLANTVWNINQNMERLSKAQDRQSSQSKIQLPSDDPTVAARAIKYRSYVAAVTQYQKNVGDAISWQNVTDSALSSLGDVIKKLRDLTVQASSTGTLSENDLQDIKDQVSVLKQQAVDIMNTSYAGRYIFAGYATDQPPYQILSTTTPVAVGDKVMFKGQYLSLGGPMSASLSDADIQNYCQAHAAEMYNAGPAQAIKYDIGFGTQLAINVEGQDVIGQSTGANLFDTIDKLLLGLDGATTYKTASIDPTTSPPTVTVTTNSFKLDDLLNEFDADYNRVLAARSSLGARMNYAQMMQTRLGDDATTYKTLMSNNEDVDVAQSSVDVSTAEYVYEASLAVGAKVNSKTLVDFLT